MSFPVRSPAEVKRLRAEWQAWVRQHADLIDASGIPPETVLDKGHWNSFLEVGDLYPIDFDESHLSLRQKISLLRLILTRPIDLRTPVATGLIDAVLDALEPTL